MASIEVAAETGDGGAPLLALGPLAGVGEEEEELGTTLILPSFPQRSGQGSRR